MFKKKYLKYKRKYLLLQNKNKLNNFSNLFNNYGGFAKAIIKYKDNIHIPTREVYTTDKLAADSLVIQIPIHMILTNINGENAPIWRKKSEEMNNNLVGILYYMDKINPNTNSFIRSYLNILPKKFNGLPCFWDKKYYQYLKNTSIYKNILDRNISLNKSFQDMNNSLLPKYKLSYQDYLLYKSLVATRNFSFIKDNERIRGLVPFGDMLNHDNNPNTRWGFDNNTNKFFFRTTRNLLKGDILTDSYGSKPGYQYLLHYGFFLPEKHQVSINGVNINKIDNINQILKMDIIRKIKLLKNDLNLINKENSNELCVKMIKLILETEINFLSDFINVRQRL